MIAMILWSGLLLGAGTPPQASARYTRPPVDQLTLSLVSDRSSYYVREPIALTLTLKNIGARPVQGFFAINPMAPKELLRYRREGSEFVTFPYPGRRGGYGDAPITLEPQEELSGTATIVFDSQRQAFVFDQPGRYEFKVIYRNAPSGPDAVIESTVLIVDVQAPAPREEEALALYSRDVAVLSQFQSSEFRATDEVIKRAADFIDRFPMSLYAHHVRVGLHGAVRDRVLSNRADKGERELYEKLDRDLRPHDRP